MSEKYEEIANSYINGNFSQLKEQLTNLRYVEKFEFIAYLKDYDNFINDEVTVSILSILFDIM